MIEKIKKVFSDAECLYDLNTVEHALDNMAQAITQTLQQRNPLVLPVLMGGLTPAGYLLPRLNFPLQVDYVHVTRYHGTTQAGDLQWLTRPRYSLQGRMVLIVDDIFDSGLTLTALVDYCKKAGATAVYTAVLINKLCPRAPSVDLVVDFIGLNAENRYLFGFGLDYEEYWRNAPGIYAVVEKV